MTSYTVVSPLAVAVSSRSKFILNLNRYRNTHFQVLNKAKVAYKNIMLPQLKPLPVFTKMKVVYKVFPQNRRKFDIGNVCSIHQKFFLDALVSYHKIEDDNYEFVPYEVFEFGAIDKDNPRVEITIESLE